MICQVFPLFPFFPFNLFALILTPEFAHCHKQ